MYANSGSPKKPRTICGRCCSRRRRAVTTAFICSGPFGAAGATPSCLTFFHTHSSGLSGGEWAGSRYSRRGPSVESTKRSTALARCAGWLSTMQNTGLLPLCSASCNSRLRKAMNPAAVSVPVSTENRRAPCALIAEIMNRGEPGAGGAHRRRLPDRRPGGAGVVVAAHPGLVEEVHRPASGPGLRGDLRILDLFPPGHRDGVGLLGPVERTLGGKAQVMQGAPDAGHGELHAEPGLDQPPDDLPGPQRHGEPMIAGIALGDQPGRVAQLLLGELARPAGHRLGPQRLPAFGALGGQPGVDRPPVQAQGRQPGADLRRRYAPGYLLDRPKPQGLKRLVVELAAVVLPHSSIVGADGTQIKLLTIPLVRSSASSLTAERVKKPSSRRVVTVAFPACEPLSLTSVKVAIAGLLPCQC